MNKGRKEENKKSGIVNSSWNYRCSLLSLQSWGNELDLVDIDEQEEKRNNKLQTGLPTWSAAGPILCDYWTWRLGICLERWWTRGNGNSSGADSLWNLHSFLPFWLLDNWQLETLYQRWWERKSKRQRELSSELPPLSSLQQDDNKLKSDCNEGKQEEMADGIPSRTPSCSLLLRLLRNNLELFDNMNNDFEETVREKVMDGTLVTATTACKVLHDTSLALLTIAFGSTLSFKFPIDIKFRTGMQWRRKRCWRNRRRGW